MAAVDAAVGTTGGTVAIADAGDGCCTAVAGLAGEITDVGTAVVTGDGMDVKDPTVDGGLGPALVGDCAWTDVEGFP